MILRSYTTSRRIEHSCGKPLIQQCHLLSKGWQTPLTHSIYAWNGAYINGFDLLIRSWGSKGDTASCFGAAGEFPEKNQWICYFTGNFIKRMSQDLECIKMPWGSTKKRCATTNIKHFSQSFFHQTEKWSIREMTWMRQTNLFFTLTQGRMWVMMICSRLSSGRFSQNSNKSKFTQLVRYGKKRLDKNNLKRVILFSHEVKLYFESLLCLLFD